MIHMCCGLMGQSIYFNSFLGRSGQPMGQILIGRTIQAQQNWVLKRIRNQKVYRATGHAPRVECDPSPHGPIQYSIIASSSSQRKQVWVWELSESVEEGQRRWRRPGRRSELMRAVAVGLNWVRVLGFGAVMGEGAEGVVRTWWWAAGRRGSGGAASTASGRRGGAGMKQEDNVTELEAAQGGRTL
jgi:hypothetical protein